MWNVGYACMWYIFQNSNYEWLTEQYKEGEKAKAKENENKEWKGIRNK